MKCWCKCLVSLVAGVVAGGTFVYYSPTFGTRGVKEIERVIIEKDTITVSEPVFITTRITDTMLVAVRDTVRVHDTLWVELPREQKHYADTGYDAWVSGYRPALDSIRIVRSNRTIERVVTELKTPRWGVGIQAGCGVGYADGLRAFPYVGVGISYNLFCL